MKEIPRGAALELYTLQACRSSIKGVNAPRFGGTRFGGDKSGSRRSYVYIQTLHADCGVKGQTAANATYEEVFDLSCFLLQNILNTENQRKTHSH